MWEIKNKKTGRIIEQLSDEAYSKMLREAPEGFMKRFIVTELQSRPIVSLKPREIIKPKKK